MDLLRMKLTMFGWRVFAIAFCCLIAGCRQQFAANDLADIKRELGAIVKAIDIQPNGDQPTVAKDSVASVGVFYMGKEQVDLVTARIQTVVAREGYGRIDQKLKRSGNEITQTFCHNTLPNRYVTWTIVKDEVGVLSIRSEGFKAAYADCAVVP